MSEELITALTKLPVDGWNSGNRFDGSKASIEQHRQAAAVAVKRFEAGDRPPETKASTDVGYLRFKHLRDLKSAELGALMANSA